MSGFAINKGINLSHWLSQVFGWSPRTSFVTEQDIKDIKALGYDHVRLPVDEEELWTIDNAKNSDAFRCMHNCIQWCIAHDMRIIVDVHILRSHHFNAANGEGEIVLWKEVSAQQRFLDLWAELQEELLAYPTKFVAYELMNEPVAQDHEDWNKLLARGIELIRAKEQDRTLVIGSNMWQDPSTFPFLKIPEGSKNILLSCHLYEPLLFTHYQAYWLPTKSYKGKVQYPGKCISDEDYNTYVSGGDTGMVAMVNQKNGVFDRAALQRLLQPAIDKARTLGFPLYCSEFGCLASVGREQRMHYYRDLISVLDENKISQCHWDYLGDFGIRAYDRAKSSKGAFDTELTDTLLSK